MFDCRGARSLQLEAVALGLDSQAACDSQAEQMSSACRLAKQAGLFYEEVQRCLFAAPLAQHFDKSWTAHASVKAALYDSESQLQSAADLHSRDEIATEICRLQASAAARTAVCPVPLRFIETVSRAEDCSCRAALWWPATDETRAEVTLSSADFFHRLTCHAARRRPARRWRLPSARPRRSAGSCRTQWPC